MDAPVLVPNNCSMTATPKEGQQLAVKISRPVIKLTQPDGDVRTGLGDEDADSAADRMSTAAPDCHTDHGGH